MSTNKDILTWEFGTTMNRSKLEASSLIAFGLSPLG